MLVQGLGIGVGRSCKDLVDGVIKEYLSGVDLDVRLEEINKGGLESRDDEVSERKRPCYGPSGCGPRGERLTRFEARQNSISAKYDLPCQLVSPKVSHQHHGVHRPVVRPEMT